MGRDKALLPHPSGGVWLTAMVDQLLPLGYPVQVLSRHAAHAELLAQSRGAGVFPRSLLSFTRATFLLRRPQVTCPNR